MKKPRISKRAPLPREAVFAKSFRKDWERLSQAGRFDLGRVKQAMILLIANDGPLGPEWKDHPLKGDWAGYRECHAGGDLLLIYKIDDSRGPAGGIAFVRTGTHADLFRE